MIRLSTLPFTTNLPFDECDLCWTGSEGHPLWPGGFFCYNEKKQLMIKGSVADPRSFADLQGGGQWGSYSSLAFGGQFVYPNYKRTFSVNLEHRGVPGSILQVTYSFTHGWTAVSEPRPFVPRYVRVHLEKRPDFPEIARDLQCAGVLLAWGGGLRDKILSRVESFVIDGEAAPAFVKQHSEARLAEWLKAQGK
jgi:hypothetical protein